MPDQPRLRELNGPVLVSACLLGRACRYDGHALNEYPDLAALTGIIPVPVCPEQLGGLPTPRAQAWLSGGDGQDVLDGRACVVTAQGADVTAQFLAGAGQVYNLAVKLGIRCAVLKSRSPSCGVHAVRIDRQLQKGQGVCAALLSRSGILVLDEQEVR